MIVIKMLSHLAISSLLMTTIFITQTDIIAKDKIQVINEKNITEQIPKGKKAKIYYAHYDTPSNNSFKSYMSYKAITNKSSAQYKLQKIASTNEYGIRTVDDRLCIAVGSYYTTDIGVKIDLIMKNGNVVECILADCKADRDTDITNRQTGDGSIVEFIVDSNKLYKIAKKMGDISYCNEILKGEISKIRVYQQ